VVVVVVPILRVVRVVALQAVRVVVTVPVQSRLLELMVAVAGVTSRRLKVLMAALVLRLYVT
jgi:hypothetical protein